MVPVIFQFIPSQPPTSSKIFQNQLIPLKLPPSARSSNISSNLFHYNLLLLTKPKSYNTSTIHNTSTSERPHTK